MSPHQQPLDFCASGESGSTQTQRRNYEHISKMSSEEEEGPAVDPVLDFLLPLLVILLMLGMGAAIQLDDIKRALRRPKGVLIGFLSQYCVMPLLGLALAYTFNFPAIMKISIMIVACSPGGTTSNLFTYWAGGDVALSITMTTASTTAALGMMPLLLFLSLLIIDPSGSIQMSYVTLFFSLFATIIPVAIGMFVSSRWPSKGLWLTRIGSLLGFLIVIITLIYGSITQSHLFTYGWDIYICSILINLVGFCFGYAISYLAGLSKRFQRTIALETGLQNGPLAIAIAELSFGNDSRVLIFPLFYSFWAVLESIVIALLLRKIPVDKPPRRELLENQTHRIIETPAGGKEEIVYRSLISKEKLLGPPPEAATIFENYERAAKEFGAEKCLGWRPDGNPYQWLTFEEVHRKARRLGAGFHVLNITPKSYMGLYSINRKEWILGDMACVNFSIITVPLYDSLGPGTSIYIANKVRLTGILCSNDKIQNCLAIAEDCPSLKYIIHFDDLEENHSFNPPKKVRLLSYREVMRLGKKSPHDPIPPQPDDVATICFTSGTTGVPKGAMISHANMMASVYAGYLVTTGAVTENSQLIQDMGVNDVHISYLPLAHMFERLMSVMCFFTGAGIGFYSGDVTKLVDDITVLRPTIFASVPRLLNRLHDRIISSVDAQTAWVDCSTWPPFPRLRRWLFYTGFNSKKGLLRKNQCIDGFWDSTVFSNVAARLGGRVRLIITGSAPLSEEMMDFLRICFSCQVIEGYGQTETTAASHLTLPGDLSVGHVGAPTPCTEVKLVDVPELNFFTKGEGLPCGEVCFRGTNVFQGYFEEPEKTAEAIDSEGWLHSGDIGRINANGTLSIIDRKKNVFKLAQGEYIAPEKIENIYVQSKLVSQAWIHGDSLNFELVAVIVPDLVELKRALKRGDGINLPESDEESLRDQEDSYFTNDEVKKMILEDITRIGKEHQLNSFEQVKEIYLEKEPFSIENDLLTPTFKMKRHELVRKYRTQIEEMYQNRKRVASKP